MVDDNCVENSAEEAKKEEKSSAEAPPSEEPSKKRTADRQITKDDREDGEENESELAVNGGTFQKADEETLKQRRIVKVKRPEPQAATSTNPFAAALANSGAGVFGAAFANTLANSSTTTTNGFGFGTSATTSGFGSVASNGDATTSSSVFGSGAPSGFGALGSTNSAFGAPSNGKSTDSAVEFPDKVEVANGEEEEECLFTIRAKLFELRASSDEEPGETQQPAAPSVPPSSSTAPALSLSTSDDAAATEKSEKKDAETPQEDVKADANSRVTEPADASKNESPEETNADKGTNKADQTSSNTTSQKKQWHEVGIGPLRVLERSMGHARIVQRQEASHKLLFNLSLRNDCRLLRKGEKHVQLNANSPTGEVLSYLIKVGAVQDAQQLQDILQKKISEVESPSS